MKIKQGFELRKVGDEYVVITVGEAIKSFNGMIRLNSTGKFIWEKLKEGIEPDEIVNLFAATCSIDKALAEKDVTTFVENLKQTHCFEE